MLGLALSGMRKDGWVMAGKAFWKAIRGIPGVYERTKGKRRTPCGNLDDSMYCNP